MSNKTYTIDELVDGLISIADKIDWKKKILEPRSTWNSCNPPKETRLEVQFISFPICP